MAIQSIGYGKIIRTRKVTDERGTVIKKLSSTGIITIFTLDEVIITKIIARPTQLIPFFGSKDKIPQWLLRKSIYHKRMHLNEI